jgi:hypothetical protein
MRSRISATRWFLITVCQLISTLPFRESFLAVMLEAHVGTSHRDDRFLTSLTVSSSESKKITSIYLDAGWGGMRGLGSAVTFSQDRKTNSSVSRHWLLDF